ncbi:MAG TPA: oxidoreductase [Chitinophagaceae bacterium]|jgi:predicted dehydrogenase|nr:oxidoreductase [Chitinophagaceae bacterium]
MQQNINVGLIGYGMAGRVFHAPTLTCVPGLTLSKVRETKEDNIRILNTRYPGTTLVPDSRAIFEDPEIDLVVIATTNATHYPLAKEALEAGKHVVVDKPFTIRSAEAEELIRLAKDKGKMLSVYHNRRFASDARTARKVIESGVLGRLVEYEVHFDRWRNALRPGAWREENIPGSGIWYDLGSHLVDQVQHLFGLPQAVTADLRIQRTGARTIDNFSVVLHYPELKATLRSSFLVREPLPTYILLGEQGSFIKYGIDIQEDALKEGKIPTEEAGWGAEPESIWGILNTEIQGMPFRGKIESETGNYVDYYQNIYDALTGQAELLVKPEEARHTIRIIEWAMQSSEERRTIECDWSR